MSITVKNVGSLYELSDISVNVGGALHSLDTVTVNESGVLREIYAKNASGGLPTSLAWSIDTAISSYDTSSKISSVSDDGMTISYVSKSCNSMAATTGIKQACICSNTLTLKEGTTISITPTSISGSGTTTDLLYAYLFNASGSQVAFGETSSATLETVVLDVPTDGEYHIRLGGYSLTGGQTMNYYTSSVSAEISFLM